MYETRLNSRKPRTLFQDLIGSLKFCHQTCVIHRDIAQNMLLDRHHRRLQISDFGLALTTGNELLKTSCGTYAYVAPEVLLRKKYRGAKADLWSAGVVSIRWCTDTSHSHSKTKTLKHPFVDEDIKAMPMEMSKGPLLTHEVSDCQDIFKKF